ncbi:amidohydrolase family protein [Salinimicrobium terrae]|uniref:amidohydrolase family protein n=1 Tax=Salinimicrobium terrae TaxID=470866 RepID=UPI0006859108|nr:amidohydrolase family protein [Salinimicrobium terrae]
MKPFHSFTFLLICCTFCVFSQENELYLQAGSLYDSERNTILKNRVIHVKDNKIFQIGSPEILPENAVIIDLSEFTVLPGLIDAHTHVFFSQEPQEDFAEKSVSTLTLESTALRTLRGAKRARSYLDAGITSIKDLGNSGLFLDVALRDAINEGTVEGPRIFASGPIMAAAGGQMYGVSHDHQELVNLEYRIIESVADAKNAVREHINQNVDIIKICADNLPNNIRLTVEEMKAIVETAHSYGITVTAHSVTNQSAWEAAIAGVDGIEHGFILADSTLNLMAKKNIYLVPTENSRSYMNAYYTLAGRNPAELSWLDNYFNKSGERLNRAIKSGVTIVAGSDNYTYIQISAGASSKDMLRAYYEAGMEPLDILQSATFLSAKHFKKEKEIGILQEGSFADIIAVKGDIEKDFYNTMENVVFVMKDGKIYLEDLD